MKPCERADLLLIDPDFDDDAATTAKALFGLVNSGWSSNPKIDLTKPAVRAMLDKHRLSTLLPVRSMSDESRDEHRSRLATIYGTQMRLEAIAAEVLSRFDQAGIESRVLKGLASAQLDYPRPSFRQTGDVDLLVRPSELQSSVSVLNEMGYRDYPSYAPAALTKGRTLVAPNGIEIDLHGRIFQRGGPDIDQLFSNPVPLGGLPGFALGAAQRLLHAAGHFILSPPGSRRLSGLIDVAAIRNTHAPSMTAVRELAEASPDVAVIGYVLEAESRLSTRVGVEPIEWPSPSRVERRLYLQPTPHPLAQYVRIWRNTPRRSRMTTLADFAKPNRRRQQNLSRALRSSLKRSRR